jgi:hypothetical protein
MKQKFLQTNPPPLFTSSSLSLSLSLLLSAEQRMKEKEQKQNPREVSYKWVSPNKPYFLDFCYKFIEKILIPMSYVIIMLCIERSISDGPPS